MYRKRFEIVDYGYKEQSVSFLVRVEASSVADTLVRSFIEVDMRTIDKPKAGGYAGEPQDAFLGGCPVCRTWP